MGLEKEDGSTPLQPVQTGGLELYPRRDESEIQVVNSVEELAKSKTWVLVQRGHGEDYLLAWSPCDGERVMIPSRLLEGGSHGLLLAPNSAKDMSAGFDLLVDRDGVEAFFTYDDWLFSSVTGSWEPIPDDEEAEGETCIRCRCQNPLLLCKPVSRHEHEQVLGFHLYRGNVYAILSSRKGSTGSTFELLRWQKGSWQKVDSHATFCNGFENISGDFFFLDAGGRYMCITQMNEDYLCSGRLLVVYDLEENRWHYHTIEAGGTCHATQVMVCTRGHLGNNILDSLPWAVWAVWKNGVDLLQQLLPPLPQQQP